VINANFMKAICMEDEGGNGFEEEVVSTDQG
jgi:hypothetical protein